MATHAAVMSQLLRDRDIRAMNRDIGRLNDSELRAELEVRSCSCEGSRNVLRDRLLRAILKVEFEGLAEIPWYEWDVVGARENVEAPSVFEPPVARVRRQRRPKNIIAAVQGKGSDGGTVKVDRGTQTDSSDSEGGVVRETVAQVHAVVPNVPVVTISTSTVTTAPMTTTSAMPTYTSPGFVKRYSSATRTRSMSMPTVAPVVQSYWPPVPSDWQYYSAERIRGVRATRVEGERVAVLTPTVALSTSYAQERSRAPCTPAENLDEIRNASSVDETESDDELWHPSEGELVNARRNALTESIERVRVVRVNSPILRDQLERKITSPLPRKRESEVKEITETPKPSAFAHVKLGRGEKGKLLEGKSSASAKYANRSDRPRRESSASTREGSESRIAEPKSQNRPLVKTLRSWGLKFSGQERSEDAEEFLEELDDCREGENLTEVEILKAIPGVLERKARRWYRTTRSSIANLTDFKEAFRRQYVKEYDREDLWEDLRKRTQAKGELVSNYLSSIRYLVSRFKEPPAPQTIVNIVYRNLFHEYRKAIMDKVIDSLEDIEKYGRLWEKQKDLDVRYAPPPPAEKMHVPGAAYTAGPVRGKIANVSEKSAEEVAAVLQLTKQKKKGKTVEQKSAGQLRDAESDSCSREYKIMAYTTTVGPTYAEIARSPSREPRFQPARTARDYSESNAGRINRDMSKRNDRVSETNNASYVPRYDNGRAKFSGACYTCQAMGHRASECPEVICYYCHAKGHVSRDCDKGAKLRLSKRCCESCGKADTTFKACQSNKCLKLKELLGNGKSGEQRK